MARNRHSDRAGRTRRLGLTMELALTAGTPPGALRYDRELWRLSHLQSIFGGTTETHKEIIAHRLGL